MVEAPCTRGVRNKQALPSKPKHCLTGSLMPRQWILGCMSITGWLRTLAPDSFRPCLGERESGSSAGSSRCICPLLRARPRPIRIRPGRLLPVVVGFACTENGNHNMLIWQPLTSERPQSTLCSIADICFQLDVLNRSYNTRHYPITTACLTSSHPRLILSPLLVTCSHWPSFGLLAANWKLLPSLVHPTRLPNHIA